MADQLSLEQATAALRRHYGGKPLEATYQDGPDLLSEAMRMETGIDKAQADQLVQKLRDTNQVHWVPNATTEGAHGMWHI